MHVLDGGEWKEVELEGLDVKELERLQLHQPVRIEFGRDGGSLTAARGRANGRSVGQPRSRLARTLSRLIQPSKSPSHCKARPCGRGSRRMMTVLCRPLLARRMDELKLRGTWNTAATNSVPWNLARAVLDKMSQGTSLHDGESAAQDVSDPPPSCVLGALQSQLH